MLESNWKSGSANVDMPMRDGDDDRPLVLCHIAFMKGTYFRNFFGGRGW